MSKRTLAPLTLHFAVCAILAGAFLWIGGPPIWAVAREKHFGPVLPFHSTNTYLNSLTSRSDGSEQLLRLLAGLPQDQAIAVVYREGDESGIFLSYIVAYFAWPRVTRAVPVQRVNAMARVNALDAEALSAVFYCGMPARPSARLTIPIGQGFTMEPRSEGTRGE